MGSDEGGDVERLQGGWLGGSSQEGIDGGIIRTVVAREKVVSGECDQR